MHGVQLLNKLKKELITVLDKASIPEERFHVVMDVAFNRLGILKDCRHELSLYSQAL